jgi:hypothetical protein
MPFFIVTAVKTSNLTETDIPIKVCIHLTLLKLISTNVWSGTVDSHLTGPLFTEGRLTVSVLRFRSFPAEREAIASEKDMNWTTHVSLHEKP